MNLDEIKDIITDLSGSGINLAKGRRKNGIYSTYTIPELSDMKAVRSTQIRYSDFNVPADLTGKTFLDLGCNVGTMSFEARRRGALVTGVEYREDRVTLCRIIARYFQMDGMEFHVANFNSLTGKEPWRQEHDIVLCCSVDEYMHDRQSFYNMLFELTGETLYLECNVQRGQSVDMTIMMLVHAGFKYPNIKHLGNGHSGGISRKRIIYRVEK